MPLGIRQLWQRFWQNRRAKAKRGTIEVSGQFVRESRAEHDRLYAQLTIIERKWPELHVAEGNASAELHARGLFNRFNVLWEKIRAGEVGSDWLPRELHMASQTYVLFRLVGFELTEKQLEALSLSPIQMHNLDLLISQRH
jgi:hypothetical protein